MKKSEKENSNEIATKIYKPFYDRSKEEIEQALATTHEQVNDVYRKGTIEKETDLKSFS